MVQKMLHCSNVNVLLCTTSVKRRDFTVREIPGTGREIGTRETGGKLDPGNPGKPGNFFGHFLRILKENFENPPFFSTKRSGKLSDKSLSDLCFFALYNQKKGLDS